MTDFDRIELLNSRLAELELRVPRPAERSIVATAREAIRDELRELGQRLQRERYWRPARVARAG